VLISLPALTRSTMPMIFTIPAARLRSSEQQAERGGASFDGASPSLATSQCRSSCWKAARRCSSVAA
jgi:hypothetical protein